MACNLHTCWLHQFTVLILSSIYADDLSINAIIAPSDSTCALVLFSCSRLMPGHVCRAAKYAARRAQEEADALKSEAKRLREKADDLLANLRAAEDDVSPCYSFPLHAPFFLNSILFSV